MSEELIAVDLDKINELVATKVMGWHEHTPEGYDFIQWSDESGEEWFGFIDEFRPAESIEDAWIVAEKLGLALIPQSAGDGFRWLACDIEEVRYYGDEIGVVPIEDTENSQESASLAICLAALNSVGIEVGLD